MIFLSFLGACSQAPVASKSNYGTIDGELSPAEKRRLHQEYGRLVEHLSSEIVGARAKNFVCMDINRLRSIGQLLDRDLATQSLNDDELYTAPLKQSAIRDYCQNSQRTTNLEISARLRAQNQLLRVRDQWRRLSF